MNDSKKKEVRRRNDLHSGYAIPVLLTGVIVAANAFLVSKEISHSPLINEIYKYVESSDYQEGLSVEDCLNLKRSLPERFSKDFDNPFKCEEVDIRAFLSSNYLERSNFGLNSKERIEVYYKLRGVK